MTRRVFILSAASFLAASALPAAADVERDIARRLAREGFRITRRRRTWLGRIRIDASNGRYQREVVLDPTSGEILRDFTTEMSDMNSRVAARGGGSSTGSHGASSSSSSSGSSGTGEPTGASGEEPAKEPSHEPESGTSGEPAKEPHAEPSAEPARESHGAPSAEPASETSSEPAGEASSEPSRETAEAPAREPSRETRKHGHKSREAPSEGA